MARELIGKGANLPENRFLDLPGAEGTLTFATGALHAEYMPGNQRLRYIRRSIQLSYASTRLAAGLEPATSRVKGEVTQIFTTGKLTAKFLTGEQATKVLPVALPSELQHVSAGRIRTCDPRINDVTLIYATGKIQKTSIGEQATRA